MTSEALHARDTTALDRVIPLPRVRELHSVDLAVPPQRAWEIVRHGDLGRSPLVRALFALRTLPTLLAGEKPEPLRLALDAMRSTAASPGFQILVDEAPHEVVVGAIGKVWHLDIPFVHVADARAFASFDAPGFVKVAWALRVSPRGATGSRVELEVRVDATDEASWTAFEPYFALIGPGSRFIRRSLLAELAREHGTPEHHDHFEDVAEGIGGAAIMVAAFLMPFARNARSHWGIDAATAARAYPGDALIEHPRWGWTHGIEIDAPAERVWGWVAQIGADRGGFYSYQWLENVVGCDVRNAEVVHPEWAVGADDSLRLHPKMPRLPIVERSEGKHFVAFGAADADAKASGRPWIETSWLFYVEPIGARRTRFISRFRCASSEDLATRMQFGVTTLEPIGFAMDRRMLLGVKERAERHA